MADNVNNFLGSDFHGRIASDANIPQEDVQKYILATSDSAKGMQTDINHYVTRDRINNASFRQKLDPISKNILRWQNPLEFVFEDISTFDVENPIVRSLLREFDVGKNVVAGDLAKSAPGPPGHDFVIQYRLNTLRGIETEPKKRNNNNNNNSNNLSPPPSPASIPPGPGPFIPPPPRPPFQPPPSVFN